MDSSEERSDATRRAPAAAAGQLQRGVSRHSDDTQTGAQTPQQQQRQQQTQQAMENEEQRMEPGTEEEVEALPSLRVSTAATAALAPSSPLLQLLLRQFHSAHGTLGRPSGDLLLAIRLQLQAQKREQQLQRIIDELTDRLQLQPHLTPSSGSPSLPLIPLAPLPAAYSNKRVLVDAEEDAAAIRSDSATLSAAAAAAFLSPQQQQQQQQQSESPAHKKQRRKQGNSTAAAPSSSPPSISVQLVMQFLTLKQVAGSVRVSRTWRAASLSPLVWLDRHCSAHVHIGSLVIDRRHRRRAETAAKVESVPHGECVAIHLSHLARMAASQLYRRMHTLQVNVQENENPEDVTFTLNQIHVALPHLTALRVPTVSRLELISPLMTHPLWLGMRSLHIRQVQTTTRGNRRRTLTSNSSRWSPWTTNETHVPWPQLIEGVSRCSQLRELSILVEGIEPGYHIQPLNFNALLQPLQLLESFSTAATSPYSFPPLLNLPFAQLAQLRLLRASLTVLQVEQLCDASPSLLHTLDVTVRSANSRCFEEDSDGSEEEDLTEEEAEEEDSKATRAAAVRYGLKPESPQLEPRRLACTAQLPALRHLTLRTEQRVASPMLLLRFAQHHDSTAFRQLESFTYVGLSARAPSCELLQWRSGNEGENGRMCTDFVAGGGAESSGDEPTEAEAIRFPALTSLHLSCCPADWLDGTESAGFARLCNQIPNVRSLKLQTHASGPRVGTRMHEDAFKWCRAPALHALTQLHTLAVERPGWSFNQITLPMLLDLHALSTLPSLVSLELIDVARLSGVELSELLTLHDPSEEKLNAVDEWNSNNDRKEEEDE